MIVHSEILKVWSMCVGFVCFIFLLCFFLVFGFLFFVFVFYFLFCFVFCFFFVFFSTPLFLITFSLN